MIKVGILGGTFDPPHIGHAIAARTVLEFGGVDEVWIMPCHLNPYKAKNRTTPTVDDFHRENMARLLVEEMEGGILYSDFELRRASSPDGAISYTYKTLQNLSTKFPNREFKWIIGEDCLGDSLIDNPLYGWKYGVEICTNFGVIIVPRQHEYGKERLTPETIVETFPRCDYLETRFIADIGISSTSLRFRLMRGKTCKYLIPDLILDYIEEHALYRKRPEESKE